MNYLQYLKDSKVQWLKQETVEAMQGYLMRSILSELEEMRSTNMRRKTLKTVHSTYLKHKIQEKGE